MLSQYSICHIRSFTHWFASCSLYTLHRMQLAKTPPAAVGACDNQQAVRGSSLGVTLSLWATSCYSAGERRPFENGVICYSVPIAPLSCPAAWEILALNVANCDCCALTLRDITKHKIVSQSIRSDCINWRFGLVLGKKIDARVAVD